MPTDTSPVDGDLTVRRFEPGDGQRVRELNEAAMSRTPGWVPGAPDRDLEDVPGHYFDGGEFLVGVRDEEVVATAAYEPLERWMAEQFEGDSATPDATVELSRMRVDPDCWGRGYGTEMYGELERRARADGYEAFVLNTGVESDRARGFYEALGFAHVRNRRVDFGDVELHLALYRRTIGG